MRTNVKRKTTEFTHEGAPAKHIRPEQALRRSVMSCFLWENEFYEDGVAIADRLKTLAENVPAATLAKIAIEARNEHHLRHVPLLLTSILCKTGSGTRLVSDTIFDVVQRADELAELLSIYWKDGKRPLSAQLKKGLARAFLKFDAYQLSKYNRDNAIKLRDVMFMVCPNPSKAEKDLAEAFKGLAEKQLAAPDTWEVNLSAGKDKKETFERMLNEGKLGYLAVLRNLRNMEQAGVDADLIRSAILARKGASRVLPFRFIAAARHAPRYVNEINDALLANLKELPSLPGETIVLVDVSQSMRANLSGKSDLTRMDAAAALASMVNGKIRVFSFSENIKEVSAFRGLPGADAIIRSQPHMNTYLGKAVKHLNGLPHDNLIVITDEQSHDPVPDPVAKNAFMINVASNKNGVGYGRWTHIDGFSESILKFITATVNEKNFA